MAELGDVFFRANYRCRQRAYQRWHQGQRKRQILRSQIGFAEMSASRPAACVGCANYHGHAYGTQKDQRIPLVCAMHPDGWQAGSTCPDWHAAENRLGLLPDQCQQFYRIKAQRNRDRDESGGWSDFFIPRKVTVRHPSVFEFANGLTL